MDANVAAIIIGIVASMPGIVALIYQSRKDKHKQPQEDISAGIQASKDAAEVIEKYSKEIVTLRQQYNSEMSAMRTQVRELNTKVIVMETTLLERDQLIDEWRFGIERICAQVVSLGHTPVWQPKARLQQ
jgi:hypothetical protein